MNLKKEQKEIKAPVNEIIKEGNSDFRPINKYIEKWLKRFRQKSMTIINI